MGLIRCATFSLIQEKQQASTIVQDRQTSGKLRNFDKNLAGFYSSKWPNNN